MNESTKTKLPDTYDYQSLLDCAESGIRGPGTPRLPSPPLLMVDRIVRIKTQSASGSSGNVVAELDVHPGLWFFSCHFRKDPVMPGCLGLDGLWQLLGFYMGWLGHEGYGRALGCGAVKFSGMIAPHIKLVRYELDVKRILSKKCVIGVADGRVYAEDHLIYTADNLRCGLFDPEELHKKSETS